MSYATIAKVQAMLKGITISDGPPATLPSLTDVTNFIEEEEAEINSRLSEMYAVPIDPTASPISFAIVAKISTFKIAQRVRSILQIQGQADDKDRNPASNWYTEAEKMLTNCLPTYIDGRLKTSKVRAIMPLPDAVLTHGQPSVGNSVTNSSALSGKRGSKDQFSRDRDNW